MAVTFDAVGPSSSGFAVTGTPTSPQTWTHVVAATATELLVWVAFDDTVAMSGVAVTAGGVSMSPAAANPITNQGQHSYAFTLANPPTGSITISVSWTSGTLDAVTGGSLSFIGATGLGTPVSVASNIGTSITLTCTGVAPTSIVAAFMGLGDPPVSPSTGTNRFQALGQGNGGASNGNAAGATNTGTGSVSVAWTGLPSGDSNCGWAVEVQGAAASYSDQWQNSWAPAMSRTFGPNRPFYIRPAADFTAPTISVPALPPVVAYPSRQRRNPRRPPLSTQAPAPGGASQPLPSPYTQRPSYQRRWRARPQPAVPGAASTKSQPLPAPMTELPRYQRRWRIRPQAAIVSAGGVSQPIPAWQPEQPPRRRWFSRYQRTQPAQPAPGAISQPLPSQQPESLRRLRLRPRLRPSFTAAVPQLAAPVASPARRRFRRAQVQPSAVPSAPVVTAATFAPPPAQIRRPRWNRLRIRAQSVPQVPAIVPAVFGPPPAQIKPRRFPWRGRNGMWPPTPTVAAAAVQTVPSSAPPRRVRWPRKIARAAPALSPQPTAPLTSPRQRPPRPVRKPRSATPSPVPRTIVPAPMVRGRAWDVVKRSRSAQFAPKQVPPPPFTPTSWWKKLQFWRRRPPASAPFPPPQVVSGQLPSPINSDAVIVGTLSSEATIIGTLNSTAEIVGTLSCEVRKL